MYEFFQIAASLENHGIKVKSRHHSIKALPKGKNRLMIYLDERSEPVRIVPAAREAEVLRWVENNHNSFPTIAVNRPLSAPKEAFDTFNKVFKDKNPADPVGASALFLGSVKREDNTDKLARLLGCGRKLLGQTGALPEEASAMTELVKRIDRLDPGHLLESLQSAALSGLQDSPMEWGRLLPGLVWSVDELKKGTKDENKNDAQLLLSFELDDWGRYPCPANSEQTFECISEKLLDSDEPETAELDAFGLPLVDHENIMPSVSFPGLGQKALRSMFGEVPANYRYGRADSASFPVGRKARQMMFDAATEITKEKNEGKTWGFLMRKTKLGRSSVNPVLVIVAPERQPEYPPHLAALFTLPSEKAGEVVREEDFIRTASQVVEALRGAWKGDLSVPLHVAVVTAYDKGRLKLLMSGSYTADHFVKAAQYWEKGCTNIPDLKLAAAAKAQKAARSGGPVASEQRGHMSLAPKIPRPSELIPLFSTVWRRSGTESMTSLRLKPDLPARLLLELGEQGASLASTLLAEHLDDYTPFLLALSRSGHFKNKGLLALKDDTFRQAQILPSVLGLLLMKTGRDKERYMHDSFYLIGQAMNLADTLHAEYCKHVRGGDVPPVLLGNSLMRSALANPQGAFDQLAERLLVYQAWARSAQTDNSRLAKWVLGRYGEVARNLHQAGIPQTVTPAGKAEMLLGYLAGVGKESADAPDSSEIPDSGNCACDTEN